MLSEHGGALPLMKMRKPVASRLARMESHSLAAASSLAVLLDRRARHGPVGAEHAAIARFGLQPSATSAAVVEKLASVRGHRLLGLMAARRTSKRGFKLHVCSLTMMPSQRCKPSLEGSAQATYSFFMAAVDPNQTRSLGRVHSPPEQVDKPQPLHFGIPDLC